eukprot:COSAG06_NODE_2271_length_7201_cov_3.437623_6_plen_85_part_00
MRRKRSGTTSRAATTTSLHSQEDVVWVSKTRFAILESSLRPSSAKATASAAQPRRPPVDSRPPWRQPAADRLSASTTGGGRRAR